VPPDNSSAFTVLAPLVAGCAKSSGTQKKIMKEKVRIDCITNVHLIMIKMMLTGYLVFKVRMKYISAK
jgi:hypothetical protein